MEDTLVKKVELKNGLTLEIFDASFKIAGDRYKVILIARMAIDVADALAKGYLSENADIEEIEKSIPPSVVFEKKSERFFVEEKDKDAVFDALLDANLDHADRYFSKDSFPVKFILKIYREMNPI